MHARREDGSIAVDTGVPEPGVGTLTVIQRVLAAELGYQIKERRITRDGMVSVNGNLYSVPNATRRRPVEVHSTAREIRIFEQDRLIAVHPVLEGRGQRRIAAGHRSLPPPANSHTPCQPRRPGEFVAQRSLAFYDAVARRLAGVGAGP